MGKSKEAEEQFKAGLKVDPGNAQIIKELQGMGVEVPAAAPVAPATGIKYGWNGTPAQGVSGIPLTDATAVGNPAMNPEIFVNFLIRAPRVTYDRFGEDSPVTKTIQDRQYNLTSFTVPNGTG